MKITFIRHGESEANVAACINDDPARPIRLTGQGRAQAGALAVSLRSEPFTLAYASEFPRAVETAAILLRHHACQLVIDPRLNERRSGMDGLPVDIFNDLVRRDPLRVKPEKGESFLEQMERVRSFLDEVAGRQPGSVVLAVSHENPILAALALSGEDPEKVVRGSLANCGRVDLLWPPR